MVLPRAVTSRAASCSHGGPMGTDGLLGWRNASKTVRSNAQWLAFHHFLGDEAESDKKHRYHQNRPQQRRFRAPCTQDPLPSGWAWRSNSDSERPRRVGSRRRREPEDYDFSELNDDIKSVRV